ncbi:MAG: hypothetical protein AB8H80_20360 [Planctomycetota bacterium]
MRSFDKRSGRCQAAAAIVDAAASPTAVFPAAVSTAAVPTAAVPTAAVCSAKGLLAALFFAAAVPVTGCSREPVRAEPSGNELVLVVGGGAPSLRTALTGLGREVEPARRLRPQSLPPPAPAPGSPFFRGGGQEPPAAPESLPRAGQEVPDQAQTSPGAPTASGPTSTGSSANGQTANGQTANGPDPGGAEDPAVDAEWLVVPLPEGETLMHVSRRHLGDGRRFFEILKWNGWSEREARSLPAGQPVRIRRSAMR